MNYPSYIPNSIGNQLVQPMQKPAIMQPIPRAMEELEHSIANLHKTCEVLRDKLSFVMQASYPEPSDNCKTGVEKPLACGLVDQLETFNHRVNQIGKMVDEMNNRVQL